MPSDDDPPCTCELCGEMVLRSFTVCCEDCGRLICQDCEFDPCECESSGQWEDDDEQD